MPWEDSLAELSDERLQKIGDRDDLSPSLRFAPYIGRIRAVRDMASAVGSTFFMPDDTVSQVDGGLFRRSARRHAARIAATKKVR